MSTETGDRDNVYRQFYDKMQAKYLKTLVCDEVIEEYKNNPLGQHSEPLSRLLHYFSSAPQKNKIAIKHDSQSDKFNLIQLSGKRGMPPYEIQGESYNSLEEAYQAVFLKRLDILMQS